MKVTFRARSLGHLRQIEHYVASDSPAAAGRLVARIERAILNLADHPLSAPVGTVPGTRQLAIADTPYLVIYRVDADGITILAVLHAARRARS
ncbi:type II toxin-antitoxin system RelE/ParE family toxin [Xanthobacter flavus]|uniref:type II toxin-antitoxin system RelE/ParE family toxin n=1 Tax=Xanthobacter flavus TaxID=281 RepID=UPI003726DC97